MKPPSPNQRIEFEVEVDNEWKPYAAVDLPPDWDEITITLLGTIVTLSRGAAVRADLRRLPGETP